MCHHGFTLKVCVLKGDPQPLDLKGVDLFVVGAGAAVVPIVILVILVVLGVVGLGMVAT